MIKKLFIVILVVAAGILIWFAFGLWTGIYSVYTYPPSKEKPDGATLIVSREGGERMFASPDSPKPKPKAPQAKSRGMSFAAAPKAQRPLAVRTIVELPYIEWAYEKSLEPLEEE
jgi:hypothetical protein